MSSRSVWESNVPFVPIDIIYKKITNGIVNIYSKCILYCIIYAFYFTYNIMIFFIETYTWVKIPFKSVYKANETRWKDLYDKSSLRIAYEWEEEWELWEMYMDYVDLLEWTRAEKNKKRK